MCKNIQRDVRFILQAKFGVLFLVGLCFCIQLKRKCETAKTGQQNVPKQTWTKNLKRMHTNTFNLSIHTRKIYCNKVTLVSDELFVYISQHLLRLYKERCVQYLSNLYIFLAF